MNNSIYDNLYNLIQTYIFGGNALTTNQDLITTLISTMGCVFLVALPFCVVWKVCKLILGR